LFEVKLLFVHTSSGGAFFIRKFAHNFALFGKYMTCFKGY